MSSLRTFYCQQRAGLIILEYLFQRLHPVCSVCRSHTLSFFFHNVYITGLLTMVLRREPLVEQWPLILSKHLNSLPVFSGFRVPRSLVFSIVFCKSLFVFSSLFIFVFSVFRFTASDINSLVASTSPWECVFLLQLQYSNCLITPQQWYGIFYQNNIIVNKSTWFFLFEKEYSNK